MTLGSEMVSISGVEIELTQFGDGGESPALLYLHGGLGGEQSTVFLQGLAQRFWVIAPTHPGFGASSWPSHIRSVSDLSFFYLDLADHLQLHDAVLVGACFGGWIAAEMLVRSTARFGRLVLIDALGVKFSDRLSRDITDIHALSEAEVATTLYYSILKFFVLDVSPKQVGAVSADPAPDDAFAPSFFGGPPGQLPSSHCTQSPPSTSGGKRR